MPRRCWRVARRQTRGLASHLTKSTVCHGDFLSSSLPRGLIGSSGCLPPEDLWIYGRAVYPCSRLGKLCTAAVKETLETFFFPLFCFFSRGDLTASRFHTGWSACFLVTVRLHHLNYYYSSEIDQSTSSKHLRPQSRWGILLPTGPYTKLPLGVVATVVFQRFPNVTSLKCPALHLCSLSQQ